MKKFFFLLLFIFALVPFRPVYAATFDIDPGNVDQLKAAIIAANTDPGQDVINLATGSSYEVTTIEDWTWGKTGLPGITSDVILNGNQSILRRGTTTEEIRMLFVNLSGSLIVNDLILQNGYNNEGAAICNFGYLQVNRVTIEDNHAPQSYGGAVGTVYGTTVINSSILRNNSAHQGGALMGRTATITINDSVIENNIAEKYGGAADSNTSLTIHNTLIQNNHAGNAGGAIFNSKALTVTGSEFFGNTSGRGAAIFIEIYGDTNEILSTTFANNIASDPNGGGGIFFAPSGGIGALTVSDSVFTNNTAPEGAGIRAHRGGTIIITNTQFLSNVATTGNGSAFYDVSAEVVPGSHTINQSCIVNNADTSVKNDVAGFTLQAQNNWWGASDGPSGAGPGNGDSVNATVDYASFLTTPPVGCPYKEGITPTPTYTPTPTLSPTPTPTPSPTPIPQLTALSPADVWVGLRNSDDVGVKFDLMAEVYKGEDIIGSGQVDSVPGGSSGFNNANLDSIPLTLFAPVGVLPGDVLSTKIYVRNACVGSGHNSGTARLWYNDSAANSHFDATIDSVTTNYYLLNAFLLGTTPGVGPKMTKDVAAGAKCSPFKLFGTWTTTL